MRRCRRFLASPFPRTSPVRIVRASCLMVPDAQSASTNPSRYARMCVRDVVSSLTGTTIRANWWWSGPWRCWQRRYLYRWAAGNRLTQRETTLGDWWPSLGKGNPNERAARRNQESPAFMRAECQRISTLPAHVCSYAIRHISLRYSSDCPSRLNVRIFQPASPIRILLYQAMNLIYCGVSYCQAWLILSF
jgi:hypothetical protein